MPTPFRNGLGWTLFLDRDGVLNQRPAEGYVCSPEAFRWIPGSLEALRVLSAVFSRVVVVTNQQGIGKGIMDASALEAVHRKMLMDVRKAGGRIDRIYHAPGLKGREFYMRKPGVGMALAARRDLPGIRFRQAVMVGDMPTDMVFGRRLNMFNILISDDPALARDLHTLIDFRFDKLAAFAASLRQEADKRRAGQASGQDA